MGNEYGVTTRKVGLPFPYDRVKGMKKLHLSAMLKDSEFSVSMQKSYI